MFEELLSSLPFNPSAGHQFGFYARRLREETAIRRVGLLFIVLAFLIQFFAFVSPPQATVADSTNDLINGGFSKLSQAVGDCTSNLKQYGTILANYGISCSDLSHGVTQTIRSTDVVGTEHLFSVGYNPLGPTNPSTHKPTNETPANLVGLSRPIYWRLLDNWDSGAYSTYQVARVTSSITHRTYYVMYRCGNLVYPGVPPSVGPCLYNSGLLSTSPQCVKPTPPAPKPTPKPTPVVYCTVPGKTTLPANSPQCFVPCKYNSTLSTTSPQCKPCTASTGSSDTLACVVISKVANDTTQGWSTNGTAPTDAQPNDVIVYTLKAQNSGKGTVNAFVMQEDLSDVLDYADVQSTDGGTFDSSSGEVVWPATDIKAGATLSHTITVKVKSVIPDTPASLSDPGHYDSIMTNVYGNTINIPVPQNVIKTAAVITTTSLPNTGPGTSMFIGGAIVVVAGYFYSRSRLLAKEAKLVLQETSGGF